MGTEGGQVHSKHPSQGVNKAQKAPLTRDAEADVMWRGPLINPGVARAPNHMHVLLSGTKESVPPLPLPLWPWSW